MTEHKHTKPRSFLQGFGWTQEFAATEVFKQHHGLRCKKKRQVFCWTCTGKKDMRRARKHEVKKIINGFGLRKSSHFANNKIKGLGFPAWSLEGAADGQPRTFGTGAAQIAIIRFSCTVLPTRCHSNAEKAPSTRPTFPAEAQQFCYRQARGRRLWKGLFCPRNQAAIPGKGSWSNVLIFRSLPHSKLCVTELLPCQQSHYRESCFARVFCPCKSNCRIEALINNQKRRIDKCIFWRLYPKMCCLLLC